MLFAMRKDSAEADEGRRLFRSTAAQVAIVSDRTALAPAAGDRASALPVAGRPLALAADSALALERLPAEDLPTGPAEDILVRWPGKRTDGLDVVPIIEPKRVR